MALLRTQTLAQEIAAAGGDVSDEIAAAVAAVTDAAAAAAALDTVAVLTAAGAIAVGTEVVLCDATTAAFDATLHTAVGNTGKRVTVKKTDVSVNAVTVEGDAAEEIDGALTYVLAAQFDAVDLVSDGAGWAILSAYSAV